MVACTLNGNKYQQVGFAYMALLVVISASLLALSAAIPDKFQQAKREREAQLFFVGQQITNAIESYYNNPLVTEKHYPETLDELLVDDRSPKPMHHLRKLYRDPMTSSKEWGLVKNEEMQIVGVYTLSEGKPLKTNYSAYSSVVVNGDQYYDIKFVYIAK